MTAEPIIKGLLSGCEDKTCIRCRFAYITDYDTYDSERLAVFNVSVSCSKINAGNKAHCYSYVPNRALCDKFEPASVMFFYPPRTSKMVHAGQWWTDVISIELKKKPEVKNNLDRWIL